MAHVGTVCQIVEQRSVLVRALDAGANTPATRRDVGGWVAMPLDHFEALKRAAVRGVSTHMESPGAAEFLDPAPFVVARGGVEAKPDTGVYGAR